MAKADAIEGVRKEVPALTATLQKAIVTFGLPPGNPAYRAHCPMAFDNKGADCLQSGTKIRNPYYGSMMLECGAIVLVGDDDEIVRALKPFEFAVAVNLPAERSQNLQR